MHEHSAGAVDVEVVAVVMAAAAAVAYAGAAHRGRRPWPWYRTASWLFGLLAALAAVVGPVATAAHSDFVAHMVGHVLLGMLAPLLLVLAAPVTLMLRTLDVVPARRLSALLRSVPARFLVHPITAAALNSGGLWFVYTTELYSAMFASELVMWLVHAHVFTAGFLLTAAIIGVDPAPHRSSFAVRSTVLVATLASHDILAKHIYAHPPSGVPAAQAELGSMTMYYLGDGIDVVIVTVLWAQWYRSTRPRPAAANRRGARTRYSVPDGG